MARSRNFWVVSPNVKRSTEPKWTEAIIRLRSAFMGWGSDDKAHGKIGSKFVHQIQPGDVILVARRFHKQPDLVGVGVVVGASEGYRESLKTPQEFGSRRRLRPFKPVTRVPRGIPIMSALGHIKALRQLRPDRSEDQRRVCDWLLKLLSLRDPSKSETEGLTDIKTHLRELRLGTKPEWKVQHRKATTVAKPMEERLVRAYQKWLVRKERDLNVATYGRLICDAYEKSRKNLIEAKQSTKREFIRMAAAQLLDYAFVGRKELGKPNMAILLPNRPNEGGLGWLKEIGVHLIWREGKTFRDNCKGQFT